MNLAELRVSRDRQRGFEIALRFTREPDDDVRGDGGMVQRAAYTINHLKEIPRRVLTVHPPQYRCAPGLQRQMQVWHARRMGCKNLQKRRIHITGFQARKTKPLQPIDLGKGGDERGKR